MHKPDGMTDALYEKLTPRCIEFIDTKMEGLQNTPVNGVARLVLPRELGLGIRDKGPASTIERGMYQRPAEAARLRRERIALAISRCRVDRSMKVLPLQSFVCYLPHLLREEETQNIDSMLALAVILKRVPTWITLTTYYMKTTIGGVERIDKDQSGEQSLAPSVFMIGRPTTLSGGNVTNTHFPDASNDYDWTQVADYDPAHLAVATGYSVGQLTAIGVF